MMQGDQKGCKKNNTHAEEEQITAARTKQHEDEKEDTGIRPTGRENKGTKRETRQTELNKKARQQISVNATAFALLPLN